jgi:hypothetical protein
MSPAELRGFFFSVRRRHAGAERLLGVALQVTQRDSRALARQIDLYLTTSGGFDNNIAKARSGPPVPKILAEGEAMKWHHSV